MKYKKGTALHAELGQMIVKELQRKVNVNGRLQSDAAVCSAARMSNKKGISNDAAQYLDVIGLYLHGIRDDPRKFNEVAIGIAKAVLDDYICRTRHQTI